MKRFKFDINRAMDPASLPEGGVGVLASTVRSERVREIDPSCHSIVKYRCGLCLASKHDDSQVPLLATTYLAAGGLYVELWSAVARESPLGYISRGPSYAWMLWPMTGVPDLLLGLCGQHSDRRFELARLRLISDARDHIERSQGARAPTIAVLPTSTS